jgi:hypothetical protein
MLYTPDLVTPHEPGGCAFGTPMTTTASTPAHPVGSVMPAASGSHVLIVDDDPAICSAYQSNSAVARIRGHDGGPLHGRARAAGPSRWHRRRTDPGHHAAGRRRHRAGREIIERIGLRPALYVSGWAEEFWNLTEAPGRWLVMQKPVPIQRLIAAIEWLSGHRAPRPEHDRVRRCRRDDLESPSFFSFGSLLTTGASDKIFSLYKR